MKKMEDGSNEEALVSNEKQGNEPMRSCKQHYQAAIQPQTASDFGLKSFEITALAPATSVLRYTDLHLHAGHIQWVLSRLTTVSATDK